ncbi:MULTISPECIES: type III secretion effector protein [unclassified Pseudomonas]|uniref:type III secretion effector protein n=1 Tax=unclassified Pseudomonas TaxID=196821 RepID=UPI001F48674A|nr:MULTISPECIES: type III secretion effector protein [unclassified Pseudomonas]
MGFDTALERQAEIAPTAMEKPMSVSMDTSVSASTTPDLSQVTGKAVVKHTREAPAAPSFNDQRAAHVNFPTTQNKAGPVFDHHQPATTAADVLGHQHNPPGLHHLLSQLKRWLSHWFLGHRPPMHPGCSNPPPRPNPGASNPPPRPDPTAGGRPYPVAPGRPDPQYSLKSNEELAQQLRDSFNAFRDPNNPGSISVDSILAMAKRGWSPNPVMRENARLANELLRRPELMAALDRDGRTGALNDLIDWKSLNAVIQGDNYFKYKTDKELAAEMLEHFDELKDGSGGPHLKFKDLRKLASQELTGDAAKDHLIQLAQAVMKRGDLLKLLDNLVSADGDGKIRRKALALLSQ